MTYDLTTSLYEAGDKWNLIWQFIARMLADCTGTRHEVHESNNRNITKKVHQRTGERYVEKQGYPLECGRRQFR